MADPFNAIVNLGPQRTDWKIKVRVIHLWRRRSVLMPRRVISLDMVFLDEDGGKIHAYLPTLCMERLGNVFHENCVYGLANFRLVRNVDSTRVTSHRYKLKILTSTVVEPCDSYTIQRYGVSLVSSAEINGRRHGSAHLIDVMGLLTNLHYDFVVDAADGLTTVVRLELADERGRIECALYGQYVGVFKDLLRGVGPVLPFVVLQFVKICREEECVVVRSVKNITKILCDPALGQVLRLRNGYVVEHVKVLYQLNLPANSQFNSIVPRKTVEEMLTTPEEGLFVLCARVVGCFHVDKCWFALCRCGRMMGQGNGSYLCGSCNLTSFNICCKVRIVVNDGRTTARFQMFDYVLDGIKSLEYN